MTRIGWTFLGLLMVTLAAFLAMTSFGGSAPSSQFVASEVVSPGPSGGLRRAVQRFENYVRPGSMPALVVPVQGVARRALTDTWGQARNEGRMHHGTDIPAAAGTPVLAAADGVIEKLFASRLGGTTLYERSPDRRWIYYYAHLAGYAQGIGEGRPVRAGQPIAFVGDTGDAGVGNFHLHFGLTRTMPSQHWYEGEDVNAYPLLAAAAPRR